MWIELLYECIYIWTCAWAAVQFCFVMWRLRPGPSHMVRQSTCLSSLYIGAELLLLASGEYFGGAVRWSLTPAAAGGSCLVASTMRLGFASPFFLVILSCCYYRWILVLFDVVATICLTKVWQNDNGMKATWAERRRYHVRRESRELGVPSTASKLEAVSIPREENVGGKRGKMRRTINCPASD